MTYLSCSYNGSSRAVRPLKFLVIEVSLQLSYLEHILFLTGFSQSSIFLDKSKKKRTILILIYVWSQ